MGFFEPSPPPEPFPEPDVADVPWQGEPANALGGVVEEQVLLVRTDEVALAVRSLVAYRSGLAFELAVRWRRPPSSWEEHRRRYAFFHRPWSGRGELTPETLRFGIELANGARATNVGGRADERAVLQQRGGGGTETRMDCAFWLTPLPPSGPLAFVCEWPAAGIELSRRELDAAPIRAAAERREVLWGDEESGFGGSRGWTAYRGYSGEADEG